MLQLVFAILLALAGLFIAPEQTKVATDNGTVVAMGDPVPGCPGPNCHLD